MATIRETFASIATAIRNVTGTTSTYEPSQMPTAINSILNTVGSYQLIIESRISSQIFSSSTQLYNKASMMNSYNGAARAFNLGAGDVLISIPVSVNTTSISISNSFPFYYHYMTIDDYPVFNLISTPLYAANTSVYINTSISFDLWYLTPAGQGSIGSTTDTYSTNNGTFSFNCRYSINGGNAGFKAIFYMVPSLFSYTLKYSTNNKVYFNGNFLGVIRCGNHGSSRYYAYTANSVNFIASYYLYGIR